MDDQLISEVERLDFRNNLIIDPDNPILVQKAWRDRFSSSSHWDAGYGGEAYLSRSNGEDALTWNVFRSLQEIGVQGLDVIQNVFQMSSIRNILFWGCDVESHSEVQQYLNCLIRAIDGRHCGTMTEPDLVIITDTEVAFIECKLNANGRQSPWKAQGKGAEKRFTTYKTECGFKELNEITDWKPVYQLIRQYIYASRLAKLLNLTPLVFPLISEEHTAMWKDIYKPLRIFNGDIFKSFVTWQTISKTLERIDNDKRVEKIKSKIINTLGYSGRESL